mmetsp:Transcript_18304/g.44924  ORF Transcript_18304/g.44924 Transcript_18304/m.44924 type:complete len:307 (-) Transcript_18304:491-1411(-)
MPVQLDWCSVSSSVQKLVVAPMSCTAITPKIKKAHIAMATVLSTGMRAREMVPSTTRSPLEREITRRGRNALRMRRIRSTRTEDEALEEPPYSRATSTIEMVTRKKSSLFQDDPMYTFQRRARILRMHSMRKKALTHRFIHPRIAFSSAPIAGRESASATELHRIENMTRPVKILWLTTYSRRWRQSGCSFLSSILSCRCTFLVSASISSAVTFPLARATSIRAMRRGCSRNIPNFDFVSSPVAMLFSVALCARDAALRMRSCSTIRWFSRSSFSTCAFVSLKPVMMMARKRLRSMKLPSTMSEMK